MNFAGSIVDNFIMLRFLHPQELIFGSSTLQKRTSSLLKLVIYSPIQAWFRNSEVLCKIAFTRRVLPRCRSSHFEKSAVKCRKRGRGDPGQVGVHKWYSDFSVIPARTWKRRIRLKISIFFANFPVERALRFEFPTGIFGFCWQMVNALTFTHVFPKVIHVNIRRFTRLRILQHDWLGSKQIHKYLDLDYFRYHKSWI